MAALRHEISSTKGVVKAILAGEGVTAGCGRVEEESSGGQRRSTMCAVRNCSSVARRSWQATPLLLVNLSISGPSRA
jgi:hypothetical protein